MPAAGGIYFSEQGLECAGRPVILLFHGAGMHHQVWPAELRRLPGWRVLALDLPGHGQSPGAGCQSVDAFADRLLEFLNAMELYQAVLIGHCLGGAAALTLAQRHPERVAALGLVASAGRVRFPRGMAELLAVPAGIQAAGEAFLELSKSDQLSRARAGKLRRLLLSIRPGVLRDDLLACSSYHLSLARSNFSIPAAILAGSEDHCVPPEEIRHLARYIPECSLNFFEGAGHFLMVEDPIRVAGVLLDFLNRKFPTN